MVISVERKMKKIRKKREKKFEIDAAALGVSKVFCLSLKEKQNEHQ
jgi:hypothetical protein